MGGRRCTSMYASLIQADNASGAAAAHAPKANDAESLRKRKRGMTRAQAPRDQAASVD